MTIIYYYIKVMHNTTQFEENFTFMNKNIIKTIALNLTIMLLMSQKQQKQKK